LIELWCRIRMYVQKQRGRPAGGLRIFLYPRWTNEVQYLQMARHGSRLQNRGNCLQENELCPHPRNFLRRCCILSPQTASSQARCITHKVGLEGDTSLKDVQWQKAFESEASKLDMVMGGKIVETKGLARWAEANNSDGARSSRPRTPIPPPQRTGREASIHARSVRLIFNISDKVSRCNWSSAFKVESSQPGDVRMR